MANLTIYLPDSVEAKARKAARQAKLSLSKWVSEQVQKAADERPKQWSPAFLAALGSCPEFPDLATIRRGLGKDAPRETFPE